MLPLAFFAGDAVGELAATGKAAKLFALIVAQLAASETEPITKQHVLAAAGGKGDAEAIVALFQPLMRSAQRNADAVRTMLGDRGLAFLLA